jgi:hypothetical protein
VVVRQKDFFLKLGSHSRFLPCWLFIQEDDQKTYFQLSVFIISYNLRCNLQILGLPESRRNIFFNEKYNVYFFYLTSVAILHFLLWKKCFLPRTLQPRDCKCHRSGLQFIAWVPPVLPMLKMKYNHIRVSIRSGHTMYRRPGRSDRSKEVFAKSS